MKRGCAIWLVIWPACAAAYWYFIHDRFRAPYDWIVPVALGFLMSMVIGYLRLAASTASDAAQVSRQTSFSGMSGEKPRDGEALTIAGRIRVTGPQLRAPFSGSPAALYSYSIDHMSTFEGPRSRSTSLVKEYYGFALTPCSIDSPLGSVRLLGFPLLEGVEREVQESEIVIANASKYIAATEWQQLKEANLPVAFREFKEFITDNDGQVRKDWRLNDDGDLAGRNLSEQVIQQGEQVVVSGRYSETKGGLVHDFKSGAVVRMVRGDAAKVSGILWRKMTGAVMVAIVLGALINGGVYFFLEKTAGEPPIALFQSDEDRRRDVQDLHDAAREGNLADVERLVTAGVPVDARDDEQRTALARASTGEVAKWLIDHGADVNAANDSGDTVLIEQSAAGRADVVRLLIRHRVELDTVGTKWKMTAIKRARHAEMLDVVRILHDAGARDETVSELNGKPVRDDSPAVRAVFNYLGAIEREDLAALRAASTFADLDGIDFKIWNESRPHRPRVVSGFANDDAATISVRGPIPDGGRYTTWTYQLARRDGAWRISDEQWETRLDGPQP